MKFLKELLILLIVALPVIYLGYVWNTLPEQVPLHWNLNGEIDRFGSKNELLIISILLPLFIYLTFLLIPIIDPKKNIHKMGKKYNNLKIFIILFTSALVIFLIYYAKNQIIESFNYIILLIGFLFVILGNYLKTIKANYFIGIKTPWTLEDEDVWKRTHKLGGILWFFGGIIIIILSLILEKQLNLRFFIAITVIISIVPIIYSYVIYKKKSIRS